MVQIADGNDRRVLTGRLEGWDHEPNVDELCAFALRSGFFNPHVYRLTTGLEGDGKSLFRTLLSAKGWAPQGCWPEFDPDFYLRMAPDLPRDKANPLRHYLARGFFEGRYPNARRLREDCRLLLESGSFDEAAYLKQIGSLPEGISAAEHYLTQGWRQGYQGITGLDDIFYFETYGKLLRRCGVPAVHYVKTGKGLGLPANEKVFQKTVSDIVDSDVFDLGYYSVQAHIVFADKAEAVTHFITRGMFDGLSCSEALHPQFYLQRYPDMRKSGLFCLLHYIRHGGRERRIASLRELVEVESGGIEHDLTKPTLLFVGHEATKTGAPLLLLSLMESLRERYNVFTLLLAGGSLVETFREHSTHLCVLQRGVPKRSPDLISLLREVADIDAALLGTMVCSDVAHGLACSGIPVVALLNEYCEYIQAGSRVVDFGSYVDHIVTPAKSVMKSYNKALQSVLSVPRKNIHIRHQGRVVAPPVETDLDYSSPDLDAVFGKNLSVKPKVVLAAGTRHPRKGDDLFEQTAVILGHLSDEPIRFVWVGGAHEGQPPMAYTFWHDLTRDALTERFQYVQIDTLPSLEDVYDECDVFFLSSRIDPFPNVAIDALCHGKPVVSFQNGGGISEFLWENSPTSKIVPHSDCYAAAEAILELIQSEAEFSDEEYKGIQLAFKWDNYVSYIDDLLKKSVAARSEPVPVSQELIEPEFFDPTGLADFSYAHVRKARDVARRNGVNHVAGAPAFDAALGVPAAWPRITPPLTAPTHALLRAPSSQNGEGVHKLRDTLKVAVQLHLHYPQLIEDMCQRFAPLSQIADFYISTTRDATAKEIEGAFGDYKKVSIRTTENLGRDVAPLVTHFAAELSSGYDLVGHFHGKRSLQTAGEDNGTIWRNFMLDTLVGQNAAAIDWVFEQFESLPQLGLLFPEERNIIGWSQNFDHAQSLLERIGLAKMDAPRGIRFPLGTMFWARPIMLEPFWKAQIQMSEYPKEPLPNDGTWLHAFERLLPLICERQGLKWASMLRDSVAQR